MASLLPFEIKKIQKNHEKIIKSLKYIGIIIGAYSVRNLYWHIFYKFYKYPPYISLGLPFIGNALLMGSDPEKFTKTIVCGNGKLKLSSVLLGYQTVIYVNDEKAAKQLLRTQNIGINRPIYHNSFQIDADIAFINGSQWSERRKYLQRTFGTITDSAFIHDKTCKLFKDRIYGHLNEQIIEKNGGKWMCAKQMNEIALCTIMYLVFDGDDNKECNLQNIQKFAHLFLSSSKKLVPAVAAFLVYASLINFKLPSFVIWKLFSAKQRWIEQIGILRQYLMDNEILTPSAKWNLSHQNKSMMVSDLIKSTQFSVDELLSDCHGLIAAGTETTAKQIEFGLVMLCKYPFVQSKVFNELKTVCVNGEYHPKYLPNLHYFRAFVYEIIRFGIISPFGLPHCCLNEDVKIGNFIIYKHQTVLFNHLAIHHSNGGDIFDIDKWLDKDGKFKRNDDFMVFGHGKRHCVGQKIAMQEIYSVLGLILIKYKVYNEEIESGKRKIKREWGITRDIKPEIPISLKHR